MSTRLLRVAKIVSVALRFGLDEILLSNARLPASLRLLSKLFFWRDVSAPRGVRLRRALDEGLADLFSEWAVGDGSHEIGETIHSSVGFGVREGSEEADRRAGRRERCLRYSSQRQGWPGSQARRPGRRAQRGHREA